MKLYFALLVIALAIGSEAKKVPVQQNKCEQSSSSPNIESFWSKKIPIRIPCKYNAVRQKCGNYFINLTPGIIGLGKSYRLNTLWMGIILINDSSKAWEGRTTNKRAVKFINNSTKDLFKHPPNAERSLAISDKLEFYIATSGTRKAVVKEKDGAFEVIFVPWDPERKDYKKSTWSFECKVNFVAADYPKQVCGGNATHGFKNRKNGKNLTQEQIFLYNVFSDNDANITQVDEKCLQAEDIFQNRCPSDSKREEAMIACGQILSHRMRRGCTTKYACTPMGVFVDCLEWVCGGYTNDTVCERLGAAIDMCRNFTDGGLTQKVKEENCYKEFIAIDDNEYNPAETESDEDEDSDEDEQNDEDETGDDED